VELDHLQELQLPELNIPEVVEAVVVAQHHQVLVVLVSLLSGIKSKYLKKL
tara:strand:+ start:1040 stop:1192 length:153 start_codon:yes stop_codon:yes gene_type:complete